MDEWKRITKNKENEEFADIILTNPIANAYFREVLLKECIGEEGYDKNHDTCIKEAQADIFSYFDTNNQLVTNFKNCYPKSVLANIVSSFAKRIVEFYTDKDGNMLSPMEKFNMFYLEIMGKDAIPIVLTEDSDILSSLMNGDKIPEVVFEFMKKIANQEIRTTDLYTTLNIYLQNRRENRNGEEENLNMSNPTL